MVMRLLERAPTLPAVVGFTAENADNGRALRPRQMEGAGGRSEKKVATLNDGGRMENRAMIGENRRRFLQTVIDRLAKSVIIKGSMHIY